MKNRMHLPRLCLAVAISFTLLFTVTSCELTLSDGTASEVNSPEGNTQSVTVQSEVEEDRIIIPLTDGGRVQIDQDGIAVYDANGQLVSQFNSEGSVHHSPEQFSEVTIPLFGGGWVEISEHGVVVLDADGNFVSALTEEGSAHHFPEQFGEIKVPLAGGGWVEIDHFGITVFDENGQGVINLNQTGSLHNVPEGFTEISVPTKTGGEIVINENGILIRGADGSLKSRIDDVGSIHNTPEEFSQITVPMFDEQGKLVGQVEIGEGGIAVRDAFGSPVFSFDEEGSSHYAPEYFDDTVTIASHSSPDENPVVIGGDEGIVADTGTFTKLNVEMMDPLLAESFPVSPEESYEPGDVLVIDPRGGGAVRLCYQAEDTGLIGVVAPDAAIDEQGEILVTILGARGPLREDGTRLEAYVKVDATYGAIQAGDLLTTSPTPGHAMKATNPETGTLLGKALEPLPDGWGLIKVFINLH
jgi:hypothetical protein